LLISRRYGKKQGVNPKGLFPELRRHNLYKVAVACAVANRLLIYRG